MSCCSRDEKRYQEKKNKAERARLKKEDNTRLREMVDMVLANDPRIKRIKAEEKAARDAKKKGGVAGGKAKPLTPAQKKAEEAKKAAEEAKAKEAEEKVQREAAKKARDAAKKNLKKWKKVSSR
jgi:DnaJ family protein C protein 2